MQEARVVFVSITQSALDPGCAEVPPRCVCKLVMCHISIRSLHRSVFLWRRGSGGTEMFWALSPLTLKIISRGEKLPLVYYLNFCISTFIPATSKLCINHSTNEIWLVSVKISMYQMCCSCYLIIVLAFSFRFDTVFWENPWICSEWMTTLILFSVLFTFCF